ncbi:glutamate-1-semialdehyde 2,1-aminomutase [Tistlia consotensis]|uniref:Glutamate-1-semialdehyde 2,1-aminomutase n=1 Tax=Tistlia consotensis USBA 355 TaxID=560819 RepID=A0A1Y6BRW3_9PROT|nr:aminotransferase class III-fold pyridoxal phosphate-dependent enzyme [Tistlia consotensis]SMF16785.1 glutamate-1-semialdehyde 2,1-aminomutase [Tistlia consotensis USBA 355]SNR40917.1 glutamate-1-semialdehyde 2,1-aminomutase [Tistlia consotensis]
MSALPQGQQNEAGGSGSEAPPRDQDRALRERARKVIPGGMWGHMNAARLPAAFPQFFWRAEGCRLWDADGNEYLDFMCGFGPMVLGYRDPDVDAAAAAQARLGDIMNGPSPLLVELAELLVGTVAHADWALFSKNGTDATTTCVTIARAATRRRKILVARGSYHGAVPWCTPSLAGVTAEDRAHILHYDYNDPDSLEAAAQEAGDDLAAILATAFRHDARRDQELAAPAFARKARALCDASGAALVLDDVRAGFRLDIAGSWEPLGVRPDLSAWSKAIANGYALAAVTGSDAFRAAASEIFVTGSFWCTAVAMAAAIATIGKLRDGGGIAQMAAMGQRLRDGLAAQAAAHGVGLRQSGPAQMPLILFEGDSDFERGNLFTSETVRRGVYLHPWHNMFLSAAHRPADIDRALEATDAAFAAVAARFG